MTFDKNDLKFCKSMDSGAQTSYGSNMNLYVFVSKKGKKGELLLMHFCLLRDMVEVFME